VLDIRCFPQYAYGVLIESSAAVDLAHPSGSVWQYGDEGVYPDGAWLSIVVEDEIAVTVVTRDQATAARIVDSVQTIDGVDGSGCTPRFDQRSDADLGGQADRRSRMSICRYDPDGWLVQSERLSEQDTESATEALSAAPIRQGQSPCSGTPVRHSTVVMGFGHDLGSVWVRWGSQCGGERGVFFSGVVRELTPDILFWALSPGWSGSVPDGVPMPDRLRS
jgi:hypothetical protein